jgi:hypothetical protein
MAIEWKELRGHLLGHAVWTVIALAVGTGLTFLKVYWPNIASPVLYGLAGITCFAVISFTITGRALLSKQQPQTTPENVETNMRAWIDNFGLASQKQTNNAAHFIFTVTMNNGNPVGIFRPKVRDRYVSFQSQITVAPEHQAQLDAMSRPQQEKVTKEITLEFVRANLGYVIDGTPIRNMTIIKSALISAALTEDVFVGFLDQMDSAINLAKLAIVLAIERNASIQAAAGTALVSTRETSSSTSQT